MKKTAIKIASQLPVSVFKEGNYYVADCFLLKLSSYGKTIDEALQSFREVLDLFLESCLERNTVEEVLKESGFVKENKKFIPPPIIVNALISLEDANERVKKYQRQRV